MKRRILSILVFAFSFLGIIPMMNAKAAIVEIESDDVVTATATAWEDDFNYTVTANFDEVIANAKSVWEEALGTNTSLDLDDVSMFNANLENGNMHYAVMTDMEVNDSTTPRVVDIKYTLYTIRPTAEKINNVAITIDNPIAGNDAGEPVVTLGSKTYGIEATMFRTNIPDYSSCEANSETYDTCAGEIDAASMFNGTFVAGEEYLVEVALVPAMNYEFDVEYEGENNVTITVNGKTTDFEVTSAGPYSILLFATVTAEEEEPEEPEDPAEIIDTVALTSTHPTAGTIITTVEGKQNPKPIITLNSTGYKLESVLYRASIPNYDVCDDAEDYGVCADEVDENSIFNGTIEAYKNYIMEIVLEANDGYKFATNDEGKSTVHITLNDRATDLEIAYADEYSIYLYATILGAPSSPNLVTFESNGGSIVTAVATTYGRPFEQTVPTPTKKGYKFVGWYSDKELTKEFDFKNTSITEDITLYAKWAILTHTVKFETNGGSTIADQTVNDGGYVNYFGQPTKDGYLFDDWYTDSEFKNAFSYGTQITEDMTIYAKWVKDERVVIDNAKFTIVTPTVGAEVKEIEYETEEGYPYYDQSEKPQIVTDNENIEIEDAYFVKGTCTGNSFDCYDWYEGTIEEDKEYYTTFYIMAKEGYKFSDDFSDNVTINGEKPDEVFTIYEGQFAHFVAKVKAIKNVAYEILEGANQTVSPKETLSFRSNIDYREFLATGIVWVDNKEVASSNYVASEGSTIITFTDAFRDSLSAGKHTFYITVASGEVGSEFTITKAVKNPNTGDGFNGYVSILFLSIIGLGSTIVLSRK